MTRKIAKKYRTSPHLLLTNVPEELSKNEINNLPLRCAHIFLGKCLPPVTGRKNSLLRTAYGISPDRNLRDRQCSMRVNARANPPTAPQFTLPSQPPSKCLDISTTIKDKSDETIVQDAKKRWTAAAAKVAISSSLTKTSEPE